MSQDNHQALNHLIGYYHLLNSLNHKFADLQTTDADTANYESLIEQLISIRRLLINKDTVDINAVYKPMEKLFANRDHFKILETIIQFYKQNESVDYPLDYSIPEIEDLENNNNEVHNLNESELASLVSQMKEHIADIIGKMSQSYNDIEAKLSATLDEKLNVFAIQPNASNNSEAENSINADILNKISQINESIGNIINNDLNQSLIKSSQEALVAIKATYDNTKSDISRYDKLLTEHINQSNMNIAEAMAKEHDRFVHKISSDVNAIIDGITKANNAEFETNLQKLEDKSLKWFFFAFLMSSVLMFMCSMFSSVWAANKAINNAKVFRLSVDCAATTTAKKIKSLQIVK